MIFQNEGMSTDNLNVTFNDFQEEIMILEF